MRGASCDPSSGGAHRSGFSCTFRFTPAKLPPCSNTVCNNPQDLSEHQKPGFDQVLPASRLPHGTRLLLLR
jgi:hypothetical protein